MRTRGLKLLLLLGLFAGGCMKSKAADFDMPGGDGAAPAMAPPPAEAYEEEDAKRAWGGDEMDAPELASRESTAAATGAVAMAPTTTPVTRNAPPTDTVGKGEPAVEEPRKDIGGRLIIYTAGMRISVFNLDEAMTKAESLPERYGGYVFSMSAGALVLKIPARKLREAMNELASYGVVEEKSLVSQDVSAEYTDIESRIKALEGTQKQLLELLSKARTVDEALHVRKALDECNSELEVLKGRMRQLDSLISFSTLTVALYERGPFTPTPTSNDPFRWVDSLGVEDTEWK